MSSYRRRLLLANQLEENICFYGNSMQDGTPTPDAPVEILNLENPIIKVDGVNYLTLEGYTLRKTGNYRDKIYTKDGKVYFEQNTTIFEIDGLNDIFGTANSPKFYYYFEKPTTDVPIGISQSLQVTNPGLCNYFQYDPQLTENNTIFIFSSQTAVKAAFLTQDIENIKQLADNKMIIIVYPIKIPIVTEITGSLAEQILSIDMNKNITIYSDNGVFGEVEIVE